MFQEFISNIRTQFNQTDSKSISIYPIGENNLEGIKILIENCFKMGGDNSNVRMATVDPTLWLGQFLDQNWSRISYVTSLPSFDILKVVSNNITSKRYSVDTLELESDEMLNEFLEKGRWKTLVIFSIVKYVDLVTLSTSYRLRFADITEKYEERDNKIKEILN